MGSSASPPRPPETRIAPAAARALALGTSGPRRLPARAESGITETTIAAPIGLRRQPSISSRTSRKSAAAIAAETIASARLASRCGRPVLRSSGSTIPVAASCLATARIGTAAAIATGTWSRKIDCQETSSVRMPPTAGPSAAPVAPALAQTAVARRSEPTVAGSSSSAAVTAAAPPSACTQRATIRVLEMVGEAAGEAGAGEDGEADRRGARRARPGAPPGRRGRRQAPSPG